ncbi:MAG: HAMP domain-containing protein/putative methionine-R-sulfoxide reductase with GAF domain, partial [Polaribacter sp.]
MGQYSGRKSKKRTNPTVKTSDVKDFTSEQILEALRAWQSESEAVDAKAILRALRLYRSGNFTVRLPEDKTGIAGEIARAFNESVELNQLLTKEFERIGKAVGKEGNLDQRITIGLAAGSWANQINAFNSTLDYMVEPVREFSRVVTAVSKGDLSEPMPLDIGGRAVKGEFLRVAKVTNKMIDLLNNFSSEVTRVAQEVGTDGKLGGQAKVKGVTGVWRDLTDNVNAIADNLTSQVRNISDVATAVAKGDLDQKITVEVKGEFLQLKNTINSMVDQLAQFSSEVTRVAQEVGTDGELGGQADVPDASGTWRSLTDNVNELADNLTRQVRAIFEVVTKITRGDLSAVIEVDAKGEVEDLKNGLNTMIKTLKSTSELNAEQDWLKTNLSKFGDLMQGRKDLQNLTTVLIEELCKSIVAQHGVFYFLDKGTEDSPKEPELQLLSSYAYKERKNISNVFPLGKGLVGQCGLEQKTIFIKDVPSDYIKINSGLGETTPLNLVLLPVLFEDELVGVIELASFEAFSENTLNFLDQLVRSVGLVTNTVKANMRTENLL